MRAFSGHDNPDIQELIARFNRREDEAFGAVYTLLYKELYYFAEVQWKHAEIDPEDIIQDVFLNVLKHKSVRFNTIAEIKSYLCVSIRNGFIVKKNRFKVFNRIKSSLEPDDPHTMLQAAEAGIFSMIPQALGMLPEECARIFRLYLEGWDIQEIADHLGKKPSTVYNQRRKAIEILRGKISKDSFLVLISML